MKKLLLLLLPFVAYAGDVNLSIGGNLPDGPWKNSCNVAKSSLINGRLNAFCGTSGLLGGTLATIDYSVNCKPGALVDYKNGELICLSNDEPQSSASLPQGPWVKYCNKNNATFVNGELKASCHTNNGLLGGTLSTLDYATNCKPGALVDYKNGELICLTDDEPQTSASLPNGPWVKYCNKNNATFINGELKASCHTNNGLLGSTLSTLDYVTNCKPGALVTYKNGELMCM